MQRLIGVVKSNIARFNKDNNTTVIEILSKLVLKLGDHILVMFFSESIEVTEQHDQ